jgi:hypothetical protein
VGVAKTVCKKWGRSDVRVTAKSSSEATILHPWISAEKQAKWLEKILADEHERDKKHPDRIELPE